MPHQIKFAPRGVDTIRQYTIEEFQSVTGNQYLPELEFQNESVQERIRMQCLRAQRIGMVGKNSLWLGALHADHIRNHFIADISIRWIDERIGYGLFAESGLGTGDFIGEYTGVVRKCNPIFGHVNEYCFAYPTSALNFRKHVIDAQNKGNELRYANHDDAPNCESMGILVDDLFHIIVRAIRDIPASAQITYDYSGFHWLSRGKKSNQ